MNIEKMHQKNRGFNSALKRKTGPITDEEAKAFINPQSGQIIITKSPAI